MKSLISAIPRGFRIRSLMLLPGTEALDYHALFDSSLISENASVLMVENGYLMDRRPGWESEFRAKCDGNIMACHRDRSYLYCGNVSDVNSESLNGLGISRLDFAHIDLMQGLGRSNRRVIDWLKNDFHRIMRPGGIAWLTVCIQHQLGSHDRFVGELEDCKWHDVFSARMELDMSSRSGKVMEVLTRYHNFLSMMCRGMTVERIIAYKETDAGSKNQMAVFQMKIR